MPHCISIAFHLMLLVSVSGPHSAQAQANVVYVTPGDESLCPVNASPCHTLDWYINNSSTTNGSFMADNTEVIFLKGTFTLSTTIFLESSRNISLTGADSIMNQGVPQPSSRIICKMAISQSHYGGFIFLNSSEIQMRNLGFDSCGTDVNVCKDGVNISAALYFRQGRDILIHQVVVRSARGIGLGVDNVYGSVSINTSVFVRASRARLKLLPGNTRIWFGPNNCLKQCPTSDSATLKISSSYFTDGQDYANGLEVILHCPHVSVVMDNLTIANNMGRNGGNLALSVTDFDNVTNTSIITIKNSHIVGGSAEQGGGMRFWTRTILSPQSSCINNVHNILEVYNTNFSSNRAYSRGGALLMSHYQGGGYSCAVKQISFKFCTFESNSGHAAAMEIKKHLILAEHASPALNISFENCEFHNNSLPSSTNENGAIVSVFRSHISMSNCSFHRNRGTSLSLQGSYLTFHDDILFKNNSAKYGAALKVYDESLIFLEAKANLSFVNNNASSMGGAIFVQQDSLDSPPPCTFQPALHNDTRVEDFDKYLTLEFINNSAAIAGDALYGESIERCYTIVKYRYCNRLTLKYLPIFHQIFKMVDQIGPSNVSSDPQRVCFCTNNGTMPTHVCNADHPVVNAYPGENFTISAIVVGELNGSTSGIILSSLAEESESHQLISGYNSNITNRCVNVTYTIVSNRQKAVVHLQPLMRYGKPFTASLTVNLLPCPLGFELFKINKGYICDCNKLFKASLGKRKASSIQCDINSKTIHLDGQWIGCYPPNDDPSACKSLAVAPNCQYCTQNGLGVRVTSMNDDQCSISGRTGVMCGECRHGLSHRLGLSTQCKKCSNKHTVAYVFALVLSGVAIIFLLTVLNITVSAGTLNGLIFYATILYGNEFVFPHTDTYKLIRFLWAFVSGLNLEPNRAGCAYNGMTGYQYIWLKFFYVFNFLLVQVIIIYLSHKFMFFTRLFGRNVLKVLATLLFLGHSQLMFACFHTLKLAPVFVQDTNGTNFHTKIVWNFDGNIPYFELKHTILFVVALICSCISLLFMLSLFLIQCLQRMSGRWYLRWVERLRPFYEVFTGPCNDSYRFWPGMLFLLRSGLYAISIFIDSHGEDSRSLKMLTTSAICILVMCLGCMFPRGVYKKWLLNVLEFSLLLNLSVTTLLLAFFTHRHVRNILCLSVFPVVLTFCGVTLYHVYLQLRGTCMWKQLAKARFKCIKNYRKWRYSRLKDGDGDPLLPQPLPDEDQLS